MSSVPCKLRARNKTARASNKTADASRTIEQVRVVWGRVPIELEDVEQVVKLQRHDVAAQLSKRGASRSLQQGLLQQQATSQRRSPGHAHRHRL